MHVHFLDPYRPRPSLIHRLDARVKFTAALACILTAALLPAGAWPAYILLFTLILAVIILSELGVGSVLRRAALALPFVLAALPLLFTVDGPALLRFQALGRELVLSTTGLERFLSLALKSWLSVQAALALTASTPFPELLGAMRWARIPRLLVAIFGLMWRYLFVLVDEALRLMRARAARSGTPAHEHLKTGGSLAWRARVTGGMAGSLFLRAFDRSDRIYTAMLSRGYDGEVRSLPLPGLNRESRLALALCLALLGLILLTGLLFA